MITVAEESRIIDITNNKIREKKARWIAGKTSVSRLSPDEQKKLGSAVPFPVVPPVFKKKITVSDIDLPDSFNWRDVDGDDWTTPVRSQGLYGACYVFSPLAAIETIWKIKQGTPQSTIDFSEQYVVSCADGNVYDWLKDVGFPDESCFPYIASKGSCDDACSDSSTRLYKIEEYGGIVSSQSEIKSYLLDAPVSVSMDIYRDFLLYTGGIYEHISGDRITLHAVTIVGWNDGDGCWICKNSWGEAFGEGGWFRIKYDQCRIECCGVWFRGIIVPPSFMTKEEFLDKLVPLNTELMTGPGRNKWSIRRSSPLTVEWFNEDLTFGISLIISGHDCSNPPTNKKCVWFNNGDISVDLASQAISAIPLFPSFPVTIISFPAGAFVEVDGFSVDIGRAAVNLRKTKKIVEVW